MASGTFIGLQESEEELPIVAVDIGYSSSARSCGVAWSGQGYASNFKFGDAFRKVADLCNELERPVLVLEAVLSTFHRPDGNPDLRGEFEKGRGWYWGPGAVSAIAASRFLKMLAELLPERRTILLAEAFLSNKPNRTRHADDAAQIVTEFWDCKPEEIEKEAEPISPLITGIPSVRVFSV